MSWPGQDRALSEELTEVGRAHSTFTHGDLRLHAGCEQCISIGVDILRAQAIPLKVLQERYHMLQLGFGPGADQDDFVEVTGEIIRRYKAYLLKETK